MRDDLTLDWLPGRYAICRLPEGAPAPALPDRAPLAAVLRVGGETALIVPESLTPSDADVEAGYRALAVRGPLDFSLVGVMARLSSALADAGIPILALSTFETDVILIPDARTSEVAPALGAVATLPAVEPEG